MIQEHNSTEKTSIRNNLKMRKIITNGLTIPTLAPIAKLFLIGACLVQSVYSVPEPPAPPARYCTSETTAKKKYFSALVTGDSNDQMDMNCPDSSNSVRIHAWVRFNSFPEVGDKKRMILSIPGKVKVYLEANAGDDNIYVRVDVGVDINIVEREVYDTIGWHLIWVELNGASAGLTVLFDEEPPAQNLVSGTLGTNFAMPTGASKILKIVEVTDTNTQEGFTGSISHYGYGCKPLGPAITHENGWALISFSQTNSPIAAYILDHEAQIYGNILETSTKEPVLLNGGDTAVDPNTDALRETSRTRFGENKFMRINAIDMDYEAIDPAPGISVVLTGQFSTFPNAGAFSTILEIEGDKIIRLKIGENGELRVDFGNGNQDTTTSLIPLNVQIGIKFYVSKMISRDEGIFHLEITKEGQGVIGSLGNYMQWGTLPDSTNHGLPSFWSVTIGSLSNPGTDPYRMTIDMVVIHKGNVVIRESGDGYSCSDNPANPNCKMEIVHSNSELCLNCDPTGNAQIKWFQNSEKGLICVIPPGSIPSGTVALTSEVGYINSFLSRTCNYGERVQISSCASCDSSCGGGCNGPNPGDCEGCSWTENKFLDGISPNSCSTCAVSENFGFSQCGTCSTTGGCSACKYGRCLTCSDGDPVFGICCNLDTNYFKKTNGVFTCNACDSSCASCDGPGRENCLECANEAEFGTDGLCPQVGSGCNANEWDNGGTCETCPAGCASCTSNTVCTGCIATYAINSNLCVLCTASGKYIDSTNTPPTCEDCPSGCATCSSNTVCVTCDSGQGLLNNLCKICPNEGAYYLNSATCSPCPGDCVACSDSNTCTDCSEGKYLLENGLCGDCDTSNGFRIDSSSSPEKCFACSISDCLSCTETECTQCSALKGYDSVSKTCGTCTSNQYLNTENSPSTCVDCPAGCTSCSSSLVCGGCSASYYLDGICKFCDINNGYFIDDTPTPQTCNLCGENCSVCSSASTCTTCNEDHISAGDGSCTVCQVGNGKFIQAGPPPTCENCLENCKTCSIGAACIQCEPSYFYASNFTCNFCNITNGTFINQSSSEFQTCDNCSSFCLECTDSSTCTLCDAVNFENIHLSNGKCVRCNLSSGKYIDSNEECKECHSSCDGCLLKSGNCIECQPGLIKLSEEEGNLVTESNCLTQKKYDHLTKGKTENGCHESCISCSEPDNSKKCATCKEGLCLKTTGECSTCPPETPTITDPNDFFQTSTFTFVVKQRVLNNFNQYKIDFSEENVFFDSSIDTKRISDYMRVHLSKSKTPEEYKFKAKFSPELNTILIDLTFTTSIPKSDLTVEILNPEKIKSMSGKTLSNDKSKIDFPGYAQLSKTAISTLNIISTSSKGTSAGALATSSGTVAVSSLFSNAMASLSKLIQIIEFSALMELYNVDYDQNMGKFLRSVNEATEFELLISPTEKIVDAVKNSIAGVWKGKLSKVDSKPLLLQDLGYPGILLIAVYIVQAFLMITFINPGKTFTMFRISIFNALLIDYGSISLRTLGYYPASLNKSTDTADHLSFFLACFIVFSFSFELCFMYSHTNNPLIYSPKNELTGLQKSLAEVFFEGIKPEILKKNWFARNYNFLFLSRFFAICFLIFNFQYLQILQVIGSLVVMAGFSTLTFYHQIKHGIFSSKFVAVYRLIQEASMTLIMVLINTFMFDSFQDFLSPKTKIGLVFSFICLLALNILLEVAGALVSVVNLIRLKYIEKSKKTGLMKVSPIEEISENNRIMNDSNPRKYGRAHNFPMKLEDVNKRKLSISLPKRRPTKMLRSPFARDHFGKGKKRLEMSKRSSFKPGNEKLRMKKYKKKKSTYFENKNDKKKGEKDQNLSNKNEDDISIEDLRI